MQVGTIHSCCSQRRVWDRRVGAVRIIVVVVVTGKTGCDGAAESGHRGKLGTPGAGLAASTLELCEFRGLEEVDNLVSAGRESNVG